MPHTGVARARSWPLEQCRKQRRFRRNATLLAFLGAIVENARREGLDE